MRLIAATALLMLIAAPAAAYDAVEVKDGGGVTGKVTFAGAKPKPKPLKITKDKAHCGKTPILDESVVVGAAGELQNVIVFIKKIKAGKALKVGKAHLVNKDCRYEPHVQALGVGTTLFVKNADPILHNTHIKLPRADVFNYGLPAKDQVIERVVDRKGLMKVNRDAGHDWMSGYIAAFDHPYFAVTDATGAFTIADLPPGKYKLVFWHEKFGKKVQALQVTAGATAQVNHTFK